MEIAAAGGQLAEQWRQIDQTQSHQVADARLFLPYAVYPHQTSAHELAPLALGEFSAHDHIDVPCFIFEGDENDSICRLRTLATGYDAAGPG